MVPRHLEFGLLGEHLAHSFSPAIHRQLGGYDYQLVELSPEQVALVRYGFLLMLASVLICVFLGYPAACMVL